MFCILRYELFLFSLDHVLCLSKFYYLSSPVPAWPFRLTLDLTGNFDLFFFSRKIAKLIKTVAQRSFCKFDLSEFKERLKLHLRKTRVTKLFLLGNGQMWTNTGSEYPIKHLTQKSFIPLANQGKIPQRTMVWHRVSVRRLPVWPAWTAVTLYLCVTRQHQLIRESLSGNIGQSSSHRMMIKSLDFIRAVI